ncbi:DoxX family protein [Saccharomonospora sp. NPDC006951]
MHTRATATDHPQSESARSGRGRSGIRPIVFWASTFVVVFELIAGSVWNLMTIEWIEAQLRHLGYPDHFAYLLGGWQAGAALAIIAPGFGLLKEWAYAGCFFLWTGAVVSHLVLGDGPGSWGVPLMFAILAVVSWASRPAGRRLSRTRIPAPQRAWAVAAGLVVALYAASFATLPPAEDFLRERAVDLGWIIE